MLPSCSHARVSTGPKMAGSGLAPVGAGSTAPRGQPVQPLPSTVLLSHPHPPVLCPLWEWRMQSKPDGDLPLFQVLEVSISAPPPSLGFSSSVLGSLLTQSGVCSVSQHLEKVYFLLSLSEPAKAWVHPLKGLLPVGPFTVYNWFSSFSCALHHRGD